MTRRFALCACVALSMACGATFRTVGMQDPAVEMVRALAATQTSTIKALTDALTAAQKSACAVPEGGR